MRSSFYASVAAMLFVSAASPPQSAAAPPAIYNLGTLGGTYSYGYAVNDFGQVAGQSGTSDAAFHAFRYSGTPGSGGLMADLGTLGGTYSYGNAVNASGQVAGYSNPSGNAGFHAFLYTGTPGSGGSMADLGTLGGGNSRGYAINDSGQVAGYSDARAFRYDGTPGSGGIMRDLGTLGGRVSEGYAINGSGQVAGSSETGATIFPFGPPVVHAFLYTGTPGSGGSMADLGTLGGPNSYGYAVNDSGQVAGYSSTSGNGANHAFLYTGMPGSGGSMADLGTLGGTNSFAWAVNNAGQVVGLSRIAGGVFANHAFLYTGTPGAGGVMTDLDAWLDANNPTEGAKWTLEEATGINDYGLITGRGGYYDGPGGLSDGSRAFLLDASALTGIPGDFNRNGAVDAADYVLWRKRLGTTYNQDDYGVWRTNFGSSLGAGSGSVLPSAEPLSAAVPEPSSLAVFAFGLPALARRGGCRHRQRANHS